MMIAITVATVVLLQVLLAWLFFQLGMLAAMKSISVRRNYIKSLNQKDSLR